MVSSALLLLTAAFTSYASAARVLVGYRTVCKAEAEAINSRGWVYWDPDHPSAKWKGQLGTGKSHSNIAGLWSGAIAGNVGGDWFCYTTAEDSKLDKAVKIWINPIEEPGPNQDIYPWDETKIQAVLRSAGALKPEKALRLGRIEDGEELLIPAASLAGPEDENGGPLDLQTFCFETKAAMQAHMRSKGITATKADYDSAAFTSKKYAVADQKKKRDTIDEGEGEAVTGPTRLLRFMPRDLNLKTPKGSGKQGTTPPKQGTTPPKQGTSASGSSSSSDTLQLAKGVTITLKKDLKAKKFPAPKAGLCPTKLTFGKKPRVIASTDSKKPARGGK